MTNYNNVLFNKNFIYKNDSNGIKVFDKQTSFIINKRVKKGDLFDNLAESNVSCLDGSTTIGTVLYP